MPGLLRANSAFARSTSCTCSSQVVSCIWYCYGAVMGGTPSGARIGQVSQTADATRNEHRDHIVVSVGNRFHEPKLQPRLRCSVSERYAAYALGARSLLRAPLPPDHHRFRSEAPCVAARCSKISSKRNYRFRPGTSVTKLERAPVSGIMDETFCKYVMPVGDALERDVTHE
jgi:hypothetical protein